MPDWIFGYGSLVWRPAFAHAHRSAGYIEGWARRFWQGSTDHRGVPGAPGRVVTLVPAPNAICWGMAYALEAATRAEVLGALDHREKGGYERREVDVVLVDGARVEALVYIATADNPEYLGPAPIDELARQVLAARGPSGPNDEYVLQLAEALRELGGADPHVEELASCVRRLSLR